MTNQSRNFEFFSGLETIQNESGFNIGLRRLNKTYLDIEGCVEAHLQVAL